MPFCSKNEIVVIMSILLVPLSVSVSVNTEVGAPTLPLPVADPGFPRGGGANTPGGRQHTILPNFPKNCMKLKEFGPRGARVQNFTM